MSHIDKPEGEVAAGMEALGLVSDAAPAPEKPTRAKKAKPESDAALFANLVTDEDIEAAKQVARENLRKQQRAAEIERIVKEEEERLKRLEGQRTGVVDKDEKVSIMIDLAEYAGKISINGENYWHGYTYEVPRHVADTLREICQRTHRHQMDLDGKGLEEAMRRTSPQHLSPVGQRPFTGSIAA